MPLGHAEGGNIVFHLQQVRSHGINMKNLTHWSNNMRLDPKVGNAAACDGRGIDL